MKTLGSFFGSSPSSERKAIWRPRPRDEEGPSGDHARSLTPLGILQTCFASPPSAAIKCSCGLSFSPSPLEIKASCWPSGDQRGEESPRGPLVNGRGSPPAVSTTQIRPRCLGRSGTHSHTTNAAILPSGEILASVAIRTSFKMVSGVTAMRGLSIESLRDSV